MYDFFYRIFIELYVFGEVCFYFCFLGYDAQRFYFSCVRMQCELLSRVCYFFYNCVFVQYFDFRSGQGYSWFRSFVFILGFRRCFVGSFEVGQEFFFVGLKGLQMKSIFWGFRDLGLGKRRCFFGKLILFFRDKEN